MPAFEAFKKKILKYTEAFLMNLSSCPVPPFILLFPNKTYREGEDATIECLADGKPTPTLTIRKLTNVRRFMLNSRLSRGSLLFTNN